MNLSGLELLQSRVSVTKLVAPAPSREHLLAIFQAAARAPDHGKLQPWRFLVIEGDDLAFLGDKLVEALVASNPQVSPSVIEKTKNMPLRAPMIIVAIAKCQDHPKIPLQEQILACGAATQNLLNALFALGYGSVWRTGELVYNTQVKQALGLSGLEEIIGFVYVGTPGQEIPPPPAANIESIFANWPAK